MSLQVTWARGGRAAIVERSADRVVLRSTISAPPGTPLEGRADGAPGPLTIKVRRCQRLREPDGDLAYRIEGRVVNVSRSLRAYLDAHSPE